MKILIAVDDSAYSRAAMNWVSRVTWPAGTEFLVVSAARAAVAAFALADATAAGYAGTVFEEEVKAHEEIAARYERQVRELGFKSTALVEHGDPREVIVKTAKLRGVDLIVVGSHGRTGISKLILGSVADHVVTHAPCNVLVIKQESPRPSGAPVTS